ncbi:hypothetical protein FOZ63_024412, partial [Perkinsus olseni]
VIRGIPVDGSIRIEAYVRGARLASPDALCLKFSSSNQPSTTAGFHGNIIFAWTGNIKEDDQKYPRLTPGDVGDPDYICYATESPSQGFNSIHMRVYGTEQQQQQSPAAAAASVEFFFEFSPPIILKPPCRVPLKKVDDSDGLLLDTTRLNETELEE